MNFEQFFDDVISGHIDIIDCWFFTASKVLGWSLIILKVWGHSTYQYYVTFSESDPSFRFSQMKKSWKMNLFDRSNPCFRVSRYRWIRWWYQIFDILNIGTFRFLKLKGPNQCLTRRVQENVGTRSRIQAAFKSSNQSEWRFYNFEQS